MRLHLLIGPSAQSTARFRAILKKKRALLEKHGVLSPDWNHIRLYMACADPDQVGLVRVQRGFAKPEAQAALYAHLQTLLEQALAATKAKQIILSSGQLGGLLTRPSELARLRAFLSTFADDIRITAHVAEQTRLLLPLYQEQVLSGRTRALSQELALTRTPSWWDGALAQYGENIPHLRLFNHLQAPAHWLDYARLVAFWEDTFGRGAVTLRPILPEILDTADGAQELGRILNLDDPLGSVDPHVPDRVQSAATITRIRQFNDVLVRYQRAKGISLPSDQRKFLLQELRLPGAPMDAGTLFPIAEYFRPLNEKLIAQHPLLDPAQFEPPAPMGDGTLEEPDPGFGFRASQYLTAAAYRIEQHAVAVDDLRQQEEAADTIADKLDHVLPTMAQNGSSRAEFLKMLQVNHRIVLSTHVQPHNRLGRVNDEADEAPFTPAPAVQLPDDSTGKVIVGCMKNEAPYILEWVAYHRAIGVDTFLIYTNGCEDATDPILDRLQALGLLQHRLNDDWRGKSPQQFALNRALDEPVVQNADWIIHIDVDEFINIRCGNGTLDDLMARVPRATNIAMTWRLFGHNGVTELSDEPVIAQFDTCAPKYCPKPHTVWGFKTMFRNIGAYAKISCHRPNKLAPDRVRDVRWVNGSGNDITGDVARGGWRNSRKTIGYDLVQLNHYALRSAESFLIKRQRGRALHVDRSIGLNYWIRMDWGDHRDVTIQRNLPRLRAELDRLKADPELARLHDAGVAWHRAKAAELRQMPEFRDLYDHALRVKLSGSERVAYSLALDMET